MRIAVPCPGVGHIMRGYESFTLELSDALNDDLDITVFGLRRPRSTRSRVVALPAFRREWLTDRALTTDLRAYKLEQLTFSVPLLLALLVGRYDIVHTSDAQLGRILMLARKALNLKFHLIFANGAPLPPLLLTRYEFCHVLSPIQLSNAISCGIPKHRLAMVPLGLNCSQFFTEGIDRARIRERFGLPNDAQVVLSVAPLNTNKRLDYLIHEIAKAKARNIFLWVVGQPMKDTPDLIALADNRLPGRYRFDTVPYSAMPHVYRAADLFVLCSIVEGFGRVVLEAMAARTPVIVHDNDHFRWLVPSPLCRVNMRCNGNLASQIDYLLENENIYESASCANYENVYSRFDWSRLKRDYIKMYEMALSVRG
jgi:1,2-diacylglycerol 3-alpha-glucosyltransferase